MNKLLFVVSVACCACTAEAAKSAAPANAAADAGADAAVAADTAGAEDVAPADTAPDVKDKAKVFLHDPITDKKTTAEVILPPSTEPDGKLKGQFVEVRNCLQEDGGEPMKQGPVTIGNLCHEVPTVVRGEDGSYLQVVPPDDYKQAGDPFSELMMYYHVNQIHGFYKDKFGLTSLDFPLYSLVNVTYNVKFMGQGWQGFPNAAFMPKEAFAQFNLPPRDNGAIVFGQYQDTDFSYDASVIYHEYTHAMIGTTRLLGVLVDPTGLDNLPGAMNEGFADYFSCSLRQSPIIGPYALTFAGEQAKRDLSQPRKCPDDLTTEMHADGKIVGSAMWQLREALGADTADGVILTALQQFSMQTNLGVAGKLIQIEAKKVSADLGATTKKVLDDHGILSCTRAKPFKDFTADETYDKVPYSVQGKDSGMGAGQFPDGVAGFLQFYFDVPADAKALQIHWKSQGAGGFGGGGGTPDISWALRKGKPVELDLMKTAGVVGDAKVNGASEGKSWRVVTLTGACLNPGGKLYAMMLNKGGTGSVSAMTSKWLPSGDGQANVVDCSN